MLEDKLFPIRAVNDMSRTDLSVSSVAMYVGV